MQYIKDEQYSDQIARLFPECIQGDSDKHYARTITFQVTDACNLACTYCYQINKHHNRMNFDTAKKFIDMILDVDNPCKYINPDNSPGIIVEFIGGEPFLEIDLINQICEYFIEQLILKDHPWKNTFRFSICSNGVLYFDPKVQTFLKKYMGVLSFSISIDGNKELHDSCRVFPDGKGSYDIAIKGVEHYVHVLGGSMGSKMTLAPANISHTYEAVTGLIEKGYTDINLNCVYEKGWTNEHATILYYELKKIADLLLTETSRYITYVSMFEDAFFRPMDPDENDNWCGGTGEMISVDWRGDIYPCIRYMESSLGEDQPPIVIGNVDRGMVTTECEHNCMTCLKNVTRRSQSTDECFNCPIARGCAWCSAYNYQEFGTVNHRATYICCMHKARALANVYFWNMRYILSDDPADNEHVFKNYVPDEWALEIIPQEELDFLKELERR